MGKINASDKIMFKNQKIGQIAEIICLHKASYIVLEWNSQLSKESCRQRKRLHHYRI